MQSIYGVGGIHTVVVVVVVVVGLKVAVSLEAGGSWWDVCLSVIIYSPRFDHWKTIFSLSVPNEPNGND